jgi:hypothetical protein
MQCNLQLVFPEVCALQFRMRTNFLGLLKFPELTGVSSDGTFIAKTILQA